MTSNLVETDLSSIEFFGRVNGSDLSQFYDDDDSRYILVQSGRPPCVLDGRFLVGQFLRRTEYCKCLAAIQNSNRDGSQAAAVAQGRPLHVQEDDSVHRKRIRYYGTVPPARIEIQYSRSKLLKAPFKPKTSAKLDVLKNPSFRNGCVR